MEKMITKASGEQEAFSVKKFQRSLRKAGASEDTVEQLTQQVLHDKTMASTHDIYEFAFSHLLQKTPAVAGRYNLKNAISELGPSGYPFEKFMAKIFEALGYEARVNHIAQGFCVMHELDVVLKKDNHHFMVECKFHAAHLRANVKVPLYIKARFDDLEKKNQHNKQDIAFHQAWVVTNTKFTSQAIAYGECVGMKMLSWSYPDEGNIAQLIDQLGLHPVTALTSLSNKQKRSLLQEGVVLCKDATKQRNLLRKLGLNDQKINYVTQEAEAMCSMGVTE